MVHFVTCREKQEAAFAAQEAWARRFEEVLIIQGQDLCVEAYEGFLRTGSKGAVLVNLILIAFSVLTYLGRLSEKAGLGECTIASRVPLVSYEHSVHVTMYTLQFELPSAISA
jgi:hypothetical protein